MKSCFLYKITNNLNGKMYIGITQNPKRRLQYHLNGSEWGTAISYLKRAVNKYGAENFTAEIICEGSRDYIADLEVKAIELYETRGKGGYNIKPGGETGPGYSIYKTIRDNPYFVSGFWFPNIRTALKALRIDKSTFQRRRRAGNLGDIVHQGLQRNWASEKTYVAGFWWPNIFIAAKALGRSPEAIKATIKKGNLEQGAYVREQDGDKNHMFGIDPKDHPSSTPMIINGILYNSLKEACIGTGLSKYLIRKQIKNGHPNFAYQ